VSTTLFAVAKPRMRGRPEPDARESVAGQRLSRDGRHPGVLFDSHRSRERVGGFLGGSREASIRASGSWFRGRGDRDVRGSVGTRHVRRTTPDAANLEQRTCSPPKRVVLTSNQAISWVARARKRSTHREPTRRGCLVQGREMAEVGPTHRASRCSTSRKADRRRGAGQGMLRSTC